MKNIGRILGTVIGAGEQILSVATSKGGSEAIPVVADGVRQILAIEATPQQAEQLAAMVAAIERGDKAAVVQFLYPELPGKMLHMTLDLADGITAEFRHDGDCSGSDFVRVAMRVAAGAM